MEADSLEVDLIIGEQSLEDSIQSIPAPVWPYTNCKQTAEEDSEVPRIVDRDVNYLAGISFQKEPSNPLLDVSRNGTFVRSIQFQKLNNKGRVTR